MFSEAIIGLSIASLSSAMIFKSIKNGAFGDVNRDWTLNELPFDRIDSDKSTIIMKDGGLFRIYQIKGKNYDALPIDEQENLLSVRAKLYNDFSLIGLCFRIFCVKRKENINYPAIYPSQVLTQIAQAEAKEFNHSFVIDWYIIIEHANYKYLSEASEKIFSLLGTYGISLLKTPDDKSLPCPITNFLNYLIAGEKSLNLCAQNENINGNLPATNCNFTKAGLLSTHTPNLYFNKIITINLWSDVIDGQFLAKIIKLDIDCEIFMSAKPVKNAIYLIKRQVNQNSMPLIGSQKSQGEFNDLAKLLENGDVCVFDTQFQVAIRTKTMQEMEQALSDIARICGLHKINYAVETSALPLAWFNRVPFNNNQIRPLRIMSDNIAGIWAFPSNEYGRESSPWDNRPVRLFKTQLGSAFRFQFHVANKPQSKGHFLVFAPTGSGKSVLILYLLAGLTKINGVKSFVIDSQNGCKYMIEAMGGLYQSYSDFQFNPLDVGEKSPENLNRINLALRTMLGNMEITNEVQSELDLIYSLVFGVNPPERTLNNLYEVAFAPNSKIKLALSPWVKGGIYEHVFNSGFDSFTNKIGDSKIMGINMNEALNDPVLGAPVIAHIANIIAKTAKSAGKGACIFIDEGGKQMQNAGFRGLAREMWQEYRKLDIACGMAFQQPASLLKTDIKDEILNNTSSYIFFKDSNANPNDYALFGLNEEQINFIKMPSDNNKRQVLIVQRDDATGLNDSIIIDVDLNILGNDIVKYFKSGTQANDLIDHLKATYNENWRDYL